MTATATAVDDSTATAAGTSSDLSVRQRWRRYRVIAGVAAFGIVAAVVVGALSSGANNGDLDPRSFRPDGTHALAALLGQRGVTVDVETSVGAAVSQAGAGTTLVLSHPDRLDDAALAKVSASSGDLVVLEAGPLELGGLNLGVVPGGDASDLPSASVSPSCALPAATAAGPVATGHYSYRTPDGGVGCYPLVDGYAVVTFKQNDRQVTLIGDATPFTNGEIADAGNAAIALNLLSPQPKLVWLMPAVVADADSTGRSSLTSLLPDRLKWAVLQLAIAVVLLAIWRARRLGRLVPEDLPVVVRQAETVVGRARLYRRARARDRAAAALQSSTRASLAGRLGMAAGGPASSGKDVLIERIAARTTRDAREVESLLYGSAPADDGELVWLAQRLAALEQEVIG